MAAVEMERYIRRGGMYWVRSTDTWGCETASSRPGVVVSSQFGIDNSPVVTIVYCTSQRKTNGCSVELKNADKPGWAMCNQVFTVDKNRLGNKMCDVSEEELESIDKTLAHCLGLVIHTRDIDIALDAEKAKVAGLEEELVAKRVEIGMLEQLYEKAMDMLVAERLKNDLQQKCEPVSPKPRAPRMIMDDLEADPEIDNRRCDKVNVNTAHWKEIHEKLGIYEGLAHRITGYRKKHGPYRSLTDLLKVDRFTQYYLDTYGGRLTV